MAGIFQDYMDPKVAMMLKKSKFVPGLGLGKNQQGITELPDFKSQMHRHGLGYLPEEAMKANYQTEQGVFVYPGGKIPYLKGFEKAKGWEIFDDVGADVWNTQKLIQGQTAVPDAVAAMDTGIVLAPLASVSLEDFILNNVKPVVYLEQDVSVADYVISDDVFFSKFNAITSDFAYLFEVYSNGNVYTLDHIMSISHLNFIHAEPFNIGDTDHPKNSNWKKVFLLKKKVSLRE